MTKFVPDFGKVQKGKTSNFETEWKKVREWYREHVLNKEKDMSRELRECPNCRVITSKKNCPECGHRTQKRES